MNAWLTRNRWPLGAFLVSLLVYGALAGNRLGKPSCDTHFVAQAQAWLDGDTVIKQWPKNPVCNHEADDKATVEVVELDDGRQVRGRRIGLRQSFRIAGGEEVPIARVKRTVGTVNYVSFPPFPAVLMLPLVAIQGARTSDVTFTVLLGALVPAAFLLLLRRLREAGLSPRTEIEEASLAALLGFGTVFFFSTVQGGVWFTAHVVGVLLAILYVWASVGARRPLLAGLFLGCAVITRVPMAFMFPLFLFEAWRADPARVVFQRRLLLFATPLVLIGGLAAWHNWIRFHELGEFGHSYLAVKQQAQIERFGLFSSHYLGRNLAVALTLVPDFSSKAPYISISGHGLALWFTTPALLLLLWPREKGPLHRPLLVCIALVAGWALFYQNSGWVQFGYRFSLDYMVLLIVLLAVGGRSLSTWGVRTLIILGIVVNLFGAVTFGRMPKYYRGDNASYTTVVPN